jgi:hypothetical protein
MCESLGLECEPNTSLSLKADSVDGREVSWARPRGLYEKEGRRRAVVIMMVVVRR